ncbi:BQ2448_3732 [Microbotryum intermedium]|uniref:BQ2448_3732 protein n=1 Tax=Microbotryum intermedium TaxID=269621 RepID=A0A238FAU0_9BASI|nr:BQ2448_3732 [Microbotryum intermedium]
MRICVLKIDETVPPCFLHKKKKAAWNPVKFDYPKIDPWTDFDVDHTKPVPLRPFRWGPTYPINMGIRPMPWDTWLELDSDYRKTLDIVARRTRTQGEEANRVMPGYRPQAFECLVEMASYLAVRYPQYFVVNRFKYDAKDEYTWGDSLSGKEAGCIAVIENKLTGDVFDFAEIEKLEGKDWNPMKVAALLTEDDLAVMCEAGSICTAGFWRLKDKIGRSLDYIHSSGEVPGWPTKLKFSIERFFQKLKCDKPVQRYNYTFQIDDQVAWSNHTNGPVSVLGEKEQIFDEVTKGPDPELLAQSNDPNWKAPQPATAFEEVWYRSERQTLRRMPKTGCILFTIRTYFHPVAELAKEPGVPGRMASAIRSWPDEVRNYKTGYLYIPAILPGLDERHAAQVAEGLVEMEEDGSGTKGAKGYPY